jgi:alpha-L-fucosidase
MFAQVRELLTDYGKIDVIWFDGGWERSIAQWRSNELEEMVRALQPEILINDRLPGCGDYETPEQFVPPLPPARAWETCMTINESWGYNPADTNFKPARQLIHTLCEVAARGGNFLLNVGPKGDGTLPGELTERLDVIEGWISRHGESIVGTVPALEPWQFYGPSTRRGDRLYLHLLMRPYETVTVRGVRIKRVTGVSALASGAPLQYATHATIIDTMLNPDPRGELTITLPESAIDEHATVLAVDFEPGTLAG